MASVQKQISKNNNAIDPLAIDAFLKLSPKELRAIAARRALSSHFGGFRKRALSRAAKHFNVNYQEEQLLEHVAKSNQQQQGNEENSSNSEQQNMRLLAAVADTERSQSILKVKHQARKIIPNDIFEACEQGSLHAMQNFAYPRPITPAQENSIAPGGRLEARIRAKAKSEPDEPQEETQQPLLWAFTRDNCGQTLLHIAARCSHGKNCTLYIVAVAVVVVYSTLILFP